MKRRGTDNKDLSPSRHDSEQTEAAIYARLREVARGSREELFDAFMDHLPAAAWMKDMQGHYVFANAETARLFSIPIDRLLGKTSDEVFPPEIADQFFEIDRRVLDTGEHIVPFGVVYQAPEGERYLLVSKFVIRSSRGNPEYIAGVAIDATETKRMEAEIERLASYPVLNPNPVMELSLDGTVTFCNPASKKLLEDCGRSEANPFIPENLQEIIRDLLELKVPYHIREVEVNGTFYEEQITLLPHHRAIRCYTMDISKRKKAEHEREQLLLQLQAVLQNINEGVIIADLNGNLMAMNKEALALHGFEDEEDVRTHISNFEELFELTTLQGERLPLHDWPVLRALRGERFFDYVTRIVNKSSGKNWVGSYSGSPVMNLAGEQILAVVTVRDITERRAMEEQIVKLNSDLAARVLELEQTNQELEAFNRMVSHDLRQPLNTIGTACQAIQMMCGDDLSEDCKNYVEMAYHKVLSMNSLIESLLKFSRSTHTEMKRETVNLTDLARSVFTDIRVAEPQRKVTLNLTEGITAYGDAGLLRSVLENLIGNAWKYTAVKDEAVIEFGSTIIDGQETFFVRDNGSGFDPADAEKLFTPFKRLPGAEKFRGFGIGLATVDRIIRRHGGRVCAEGAPEKGATFYFTLPPEGTELLEV